MEILKNKVYKADCLNIMSQIPDSSIDACITDPPYNISGHKGRKEIGWMKSNKYWTEEKNFSKIDASWDKYKEDDYDNFTYLWIKEITRIVKPNGNIAIFGTYHNIYKIGNILQTLNLRIINSLVWYKRNAFPNITQRMFCESTEHIIWATNNSNQKAKNWTFNYKLMKEINGGKQMRNLFDIPMTKASEKTYGKHPTQKPLELIQHLILALTKENDIVIDPFMGSGTTGVAAIKHKRNFIGIEIDDNYVRLAEKRIKNSEKELGASNLQLF